MENRPKRIDNYVMDRELGRGATSEVWLAHHAHMPHRQVAVKLLLNQNKETVQRFTREANLLSHLNHANIVKIYDHGRSQNFYYSIIEYVPGCSLHHLLERMKRLEFLDAVAIFKQIASALDYAHSLQIIHRDVSPGNVLVEKETGHTLLTDFGIARDINQKITVDEKVMGTPGYWSPEHARSATEVTHLSDIYGLGVVLYVMLSGDLPWEEEPGTPEHPFGPLIPLKSRGIHNLPAGVERIIQTMLAHDPSKRFPSAQAAVDELERLAKRHHATTQTDGKTSANAEQRTQATAHSTASFAASGVEPNDVENVLGPDLIRAPIVEAHTRAEELCQSAIVAELLNGWSTEGFAGGVFRRALLGRLARLHRVVSRNVYFYSLQVLYEERGEPKIIEEPDYETKEYPLEPETDRWKVTLPSVQIFEDNAGGQETIPGSVRVIKCSECSGKGKIVCSRCKGHRRIRETRTVPVEPPMEQKNGYPTGQAGQRRPVQAQAQAETSRNRRSASTATSSDASFSYASLLQNPPGSVSSAGSVASSQTRTEVVLVPCPDCEGIGGIHCGYCDGTGRMVQHKAFRWQRTTRLLASNDDLPQLDEKWLVQCFEPREIYRERVHGDAQSSKPAFRKEWTEIPRVKELIEQMTAATNANRRVILSELVISMIPVTEVTFDLGKKTSLLDILKKQTAHEQQEETDEENEDEDKEEGEMYEISIYGFERNIPPDWRLLNWERVVSFWVVTFMFVLTIVLAVFLLM